MRKYYVFLIVSAMALLTGCGSQKGLSGKSPEPNNNTQKPTVVTIPTSKATALLKNTGTSEVNEAVSVKRARLVSDYLKKKGVGNITTSGESYNHPIAGNETAAGRAKNRRVEIFVSTIGKYNPYKN